MKVVYLPLVVACVTIVSAQDHPNVRHMERAFPTPKMEKVVFPYLVPMMLPTTFPSSFDNVNMIAAEADQLPAQNESSIAVNPKNPRNLIGSAVDYRGGGSTWAYYSRDGGVSWNNVTLGRARPGWSSSNDPSVCFDHEGRGYLCYGGFNRQGNVQFGENGIFVSTTTDGGQTWDMQHTAVIIHTGMQTADSSFEDKYYIHADTSSASPYRGHLYIPWKRVINRDSSTGIVISKSTDKGRTWGAPVAVSNRFPRTSEDTTFGQSFPLARTGPDGSVHLVWNSGTERAVRYARSGDGGVTWTAPRILHNYNPFGEKSTISGQTNSRVKGVVRAEAYPTLVVDNTNGSRRGWLYLCWAADRIPNIYFSRSTDNGETWSAPTIVHSDTTNDQFWPWIALDPTSGNLAVMYFDSRDDEANILVNCYVSHSTDGGTTWVDRRVGDAENDLRRNPFDGNTFAGDYSGCDYHDGTVYPSWVDMRNVTQLNSADNDVYTAVVRTTAPGSPETFDVTTIATDNRALDLTWSAVTERTFGQQLDTTGARYIIRRNGTGIIELPLNVTSYRDENLTPWEMYRYELRVVAGTDTSGVRRDSARAGGARLAAAPQILSARGKDDSTIVLRIQLPRFRADGETPLSTLTSIRIREGSGTLQELDLDVRDTGTVIERTVQATASGWYHLYADAGSDQESTVVFGETSDTITVFTGNIRRRRQDFAEWPRLLRLRGSWNVRTDFVRSGGSLEDTPGSSYGPIQRDSVILHPFVMDGENTLTISMWHAAFFDPGDTAVVEVGSSREGPWTTVGTFNAGTEPRWADITKGDDAWRLSVLTARVKPADTAYVLLRTRTNASRHSDGWYVDEIFYETSTGVNSDNVILDVRPLPVGLSASIGLPTVSPIVSVDVHDIVGHYHNLSWQHIDHTLVLDTRSLSSGTYVVTIRTVGGDVYRAKLLRER